MKTRFLIILACAGFLTMVSPAFASEHGKCDAICILDSSWDGTEYVSPARHIGLKLKSIQMKGCM